MRDLISRRTIENALIAGVACTLASLPNLYYLCFVGLRGKFLERLTPRMLPGLMLFHVWGVVIVSFMCAAFGFAWSKKYGLAGLGGFTWLKADLWKLVLIGLIFATVPLFTFDRYFSILMPYFYPSNPLWILSISLKASFFNEVIRFGMMALIVRLAKKIYLSNIIVSLFLVYIGVRSFRLVGLEMEWDYFSMSCLVWSFIFNLSMGYLYARFGIISTMFIQFVISLRLFAVSLFF